jgi:hypothetical protein
MSNPQFAPEAEALAVCPFCGDPPHLRRLVESYPAEGDHPAGEYDAWFNIQCDNCGIEIGDEYRSDAIAAWNHRAPGSTGAVAPEPAGWRYRHYDDRGQSPWNYVSTKYEWLDREYLEVEPLFTHPVPADTGQGGRVTVTVHHHPDNEPSPALDALVSAAVQQFTAEPPWTMRLAHAEQRTAIEMQASDLKGAIEALGGHPLLTDALRAADLAMRTLGKWHDAGEPGAALDAGART